MKPNRRLSKALVKALAGGESKAAKPAMDADLQKIVSNAKLNRVELAKLANQMEKLVQQIRKSLAQPTSGKPGKIKWGPKEQAEARRCGQASEILCRLRKHVWNYNGMALIKAQGICGPSETKPAIVCLSWTVNTQGLSDELKQKFFEQCRKAVFQEIRQMFAGICEVQFISKPNLNPLYACHHEEENL